MKSETSSRRLSQLQKHILVELYYRTEKGKFSAKHWNLLFIVAQRYKFKGKTDNDGWVEYGKIYQYGKRPYQYINKAFQVSFCRSLQTLKERGLVTIFDFRKASEVSLTVAGTDLARVLIAKVHGRTRKDREALIAKMPVCIPPNKRESAAALVRRVFAELEANDH